MSRILRSVLLVALVAQAMSWDPYPNWNPFGPIPSFPYNPYGPIPSFGPFTPDPNNPYHPIIPSFNPGDYTAKECGLGCSNCDAIKCKSCYGYQMEHIEGGIGLEWDCSKNKIASTDNCLEQAVKDVGDVVYKAYCSKCKIGYSLDEASSLTRCQMTKTAPHPNCLQEGLNREGELVCQVCKKGYPAPDSRECLEKKLSDNCITGQTTVSSNKKWVTEKCYRCAKDYVNWNGNCRPLPEGHQGCRYGANPMGSSLTCMECDTANGYYMKGGDGGFDKCFKY